MNTTYRLTSELIARTDIPTTATVVTRSEEKGRELFEFWFLDDFDASVGAYALDSGHVLSWTTAQDDSGHRIVDVAVINPDGSMVAFGAKGAPIVAA